MDKDCGNDYVCANQECKEINECLKERVPIGPGASYTNLPGWFTCPMPLVGDDYDKSGCRSPHPVCHQDPDCKDEQKSNPVTMSVRDLEFVVKEQFEKQSIQRQNLSVLWDTEEIRSLSVLFATPVLVFLTVLLT